MTNREDLLARSMVDLADTLVDDFDVIDLLSLLNRRCVEVLDMSAAGIMLVSPSGHLHLMASSSEAVRLVELFEIQSEEGPCMDCFRSGQPVISVDLDAAGERWPRFADVARDAGFRAAHAVPLRLRGRTIGALNLFDTQVGALDQADVVAGQALADIATIAILQNRAAAEALVLNDQLSNALASRVIIEQAKGVLAEQGDLDMEAAFDRLRTYSRSRGARLADVARTVVEGQLSWASLTRPDDAPTPEPPALRP